MAARDFMYLEEVLVAASGLSQVRYSPEQRPSGERDAILIDPEALEYALEQQKESCRAQVQAQITALEQQLSMMLPEEGATDLQAQQLRDAIGSLSALLKDIDGARSFGALMNVSLAMTGALDRAQSIGGDARAEASLQSSVLMSEKVQEYFEQYTMAFRQEVAAFNSYVEEHGFAAAWDQFDVSYDNMGVAHAHLLQNDPEYARTIIEMDKRAEERKKAANTDWEILEQIAAENGISIEDARKRLAGIDAQIAKARANGEDAALRDLEVQREQFIGQTATDIHKQTGDDRAKDLADNADARWEAAMEERKQAHKAFMEAAREAMMRDGLEGPEIEEKLAQYQSEYETRTNVLEQGDFSALERAIRVEEGLREEYITEIFEPNVEPEERAVENGATIEAPEQEQLAKARATERGLSLTAFGTVFGTVDRMAIARQQAIEEGVTGSGITVDTAEEEPDIETAAAENSKLPKGKPKGGESKTV